MDDLDQYLFDLNGYIVVRGALKRDELETLNRRLEEAGVDALVEEYGYVHTGFPDMDGNLDAAAGPIDVNHGLLMDWGPELRKLIDLPVLRSYLAAILGDAYRLDHSYGIFARERGGNVQVKHSLHNGGTPYDPSQSYHFRDGKMYSGLLVVSFALTPVAPGDGGFCVIPGSHKANFPVPTSIAQGDYGWPVVQPALAAGDALIFTEAVTHGAMPWLALHDRRAILLKYAPGFMQWEMGSPWVDSVDDRFTTRQQSILRSPYAGNRPAHP
jgi:hypothetical protein